MLLVAAVVALIWANSPWVAQYNDLWHTPIGVQFGTFEFTKSLHFWINDGLMAIFFLVVGMEIRRELHEGALSDVKQAILPVAAALGGVVVPALIYVAMNGDPVRRQGWAVPTATDIAFAVGILALLGKRVPPNVRVFLLALAIIDDIIAVLVIALFYSSGLNLIGFAVAGAGVLGVIGLQRIGIGAALAYVIPGLATWIGFYMTGAHPTLAGVVLGLLTPVRSMRLRENPVELVVRTTKKLLDSNHEDDESRVASRLKQLRVAQRELLPPVVRAQMSIHPWVAYVIMPLFALANAGVAINMKAIGGESQSVMVGVALALVAGKPIGIIGVSLLSVRLGLCRLPSGVSWAWISAAGFLAGIGFTMSMFIAMLAFSSEALLGPAKLGILVGSAVSAVLGLGVGYWAARRDEQQSTLSD